MDKEEVVEFIEWYWLNISGKPYHTTSEEVADWFIEDSEEKKRLRIERNKLKK